VSPSIDGAAHAITCIATLRRLHFEFPRFYIELPPLTDAYKWHRLWRTVLLVTNCFTWILQHTVTFKRWNLKGGGLIICIRAKHENGLNHQEGDAS
jgi:hypothetical protein